MIKNGLGMWEHDRWWDQEQNVGYTEDDEEPDFYWNDDLKIGNGNGNSTDKVKDGEESHDE